jgi:mannose-1-phosphate guanylyltransferase
MLLQATLQRLAGLCPIERTWIVTNPTQAKLLRRLLPDFPSGQVIVEPAARDTAPCIALAMATIAAQDPAATLAVLPADHVIAPTAAFQQLLRRGAALAADDQTLVTFGIRPTFAATGYGYLECGTAIDDRSPAAYTAIRFREKPDAATAQQFVQHGGFRWNSGIFVWTVAAMRAAMAQANTELAAGTTAMLDAARAGDTRRLRRLFGTLPKTSIDFGVMERAPRVAVVAADLQWDDVGSFPALATVGTTDAAANAVLATGGASHLALQSHGNLVYAEGRRTVVLFGVDDLTVVAVGDVVMVCPKHRATDLKTLVEHVRQSGRTDLL